MFPQHEQTNFPTVSEQALASHHALETLWKDSGLSVDPWDSALGRVKVAGSSFKSIEHPQNHSRTVSTPEMTSVDVNWQRQRKFASGDWQLQEPGQHDSHPSNRLLNNEQQMTPKMATGNQEFFGENESNRSSFGSVHNSMQSPTVPNDCNLNRKSIVNENHPLLYSALPRESNLNRPSVGNEQNTLHYPSQPNESNRPTFGNLYNPLHSTFATPSKPHPQHQYQHNNDYGYDKYLEYNKYPLSDRGSDMYASRDNDKRLGSDMNPSAELFEFNPSCGAAQPQVKVLEPQWKDVAPRQYAHRAQIQQEFESGQEPDWATRVKLSSSGSPEDPQMSLRKQGKTPAFCSDNAGNQAAPYRPALGTSAPYAGARITSKAPIEKFRPRINKESRPIQSMNETPRYDTQESQGSSSKSHVKPKIFNTGVPIGVFIWGFPSSTRTSQIMLDFEKFGEIKTGKASMNNLVGIDVKMGTSYAVIDFEAPESVGRVVDAVAATRFFGMSGMMQVRPRFDKFSTPFFDHPVAYEKLSAVYPGRRDDYFTLHLPNSPYHVNKVNANIIKCDVDRLFVNVSEIKRIKIVQNTGRSSSVFITFRTSEAAKRLLVYIKNLAKTRGYLFKGSTEPPAIEYPTTEASKTQNAPQSPSPSLLRVESEEIGFVAPGVYRTEQAYSMSKKARKQAAASNRIIYIRDLTIGKQELSNSLSAFGKISSLHILTHEFASLTGLPTQTAFIEFESSTAASNAISVKSCGGTLPRHKRIDLPGIVADVPEIQKYFEGVAEIKQIFLGDAGNECLCVEFVTAVGAAKAAVHSRTFPFRGSLIEADYSTSIKVEEDNDDEHRVKIGDSNAEDGVIDRKSNEVRDLCDGMADLGISEPLKSADDALASNDYATKVEGKKAQSPMIEQEPKMCDNNKCFAPAA